MTITITQADLDAVLDANPLLNANGYGKPNGYSYDTAAGREQLRGLLEEVQHCVKYLHSQAWQSRLSSRSLNSYNLKHLAENWGDFGYVCNGAMIAAALIVGIRIRLDSLNPTIGIASKNR
ncbi:hypothetical protein [Kitasatospora phosalacinea]|uniref:Uncharacterized protein n=1 Tax=Kitasatospora phosalacinea TaxID=2065 RepID=A0A9W6PNA2_9ACTN|nr:hypothetical protein [Kitasatospora phosalacinea]GLW58127.1 hypothetical protein Kpho01_61380 [Kitasatospora phosalacinea]